MAHLINSTADLQQQLGGAINTSLEFDSIKPFLNDAYQKHIEPWMSAAFYKIVVDTDVSEMETDPYEDLRPLICSALARLALYEYLPYAVVQLSNSGMHREETENRKSSYKYQEIQYRRAMLTSGYDAIERLVEYLVTQRSVTAYAQWVTDGGMKRARATLLYSAAQMREAFSRNIDRYAFETLRPLISDVETFGIRAAIPKTLWERLRTAVLTGSAEAQEDADIALLTIMRRAIAGWAMREGLIRGWIQYQGNAVMHVELSDANGLQSERAAEPQAVSAWLNREESWSNRHMSDARQLIYDNPDDYPEAFDGADAWPEVMPSRFPEPEQPDNLPLLPSTGPDLSTPTAGAGIVRF